MSFESNPLGMACERWLPRSSPEYDVFLSFRGVDTRKTFTDHLYKALTQDGYRTFRDENEIERGENINSELGTAIRNSKTSVIVISKDYANSKPCLFELQTILEHRKASGHIVLPVFYDVDPSEIKEQAKKLCFEGKTNEEVLAWRASLEELMSMAGIVSRNQCNGYEAELIDEIKKFLNSKILDYFPENYEKWQSLQESVEDLTAKAKDIRDTVCSRMFQIWKRPKKEVEIWLRDVARLDGEVQRLGQELRGESMQVHSPVQLRKIIAEKFEKVVELQKKRKGFNDDLLVDVSPISLLMTPSKESRSTERVREYLMETLAPYM